MNEVILNDVINHYRFAILRFADCLLGDRKVAMWQQGIHSGHLNALTQASPHCAKTVEEATQWFMIAIDYLKNYALRSDRGAEGG